MANLGSMKDGQEKSGRERRQFPRAAAEWPLTLSLPEGDFKARLRDISAAGLCFFLDRKVPEMTVLELELRLPNAAGEESALSCRGAVVRCEALSPHVDHYEVAVFLHDISDDHRKVIEDYVSTVERDPSN